LSNGLKEDIPYPVAAPGKQRGRKYGVVSCSARRKIDSGDEFKLNKWLIENTIIEKMLKSQAAIAAKMQQRA
jgi:hypothetical protein